MTTPMKTGITYETALRLKEAGFPETYFHYNDNELVAYDEPIRRPLLSELIEACGDTFDALTRTPFSKLPWQARGQWEDVRLIEYRSGSTPEEAVAELYLFLNKK